MRLSGENFCRFGATAVAIAVIIYGILCAMPTEFLHNVDRERREKLLSRLESKLQMELRQKLMLRSGPS